MLTFQILQSNPGKTAAELYGIEHLLRLFGEPAVKFVVLDSLICTNAVKLGPMLVHTGMDDDSIGLLKTHFHDFLGYVYPTEHLLLYGCAHAPSGCFVCDFEAGMLMLTS